MPKKSSVEGYAILLNSIYLALSHLSSRRATVINVIKPAEVLKSNSNRVSETEVKPISAEARICSKTPTKVIKVSAEGKTNTFPSPLLISPQPI